ncbi:hypothetical protein ILYODFUR_030648 [Ilyodon furcidens]|uniref:Uncharacterized protein n=1 Tax=Ilyodon furcidens TaxID=33524 RepID=A0ABV0V9A9_9TELE
MYISVVHHAVVLMFLWHMANQNSFREISDKCDVPHSSAHRIILEVLNTICTMEPTFISWPNAWHQLKQTSKGTPRSIMEDTRIDTVVRIIMAASFLHNFGASETCQENQHGCPKQERTQVQTGRQRQRGELK